MCMPHLFVHVSDHGYMAVSISGLLWILLLYKHRYTELTFKLQLLCNNNNSNNNNHSSQCLLGTKCQKRHDSKCFTHINSFNTQTTSWVSYYYHSCFPGEETEAQSLVILPEVAELDVVESQRTQAVCFRVELLISLQPALGAPLVSIGMLQG